MGTLIIGSTALKQHFPNEVRDPKDFDAFSSVDLAKTDTFWHPCFEEWVGEGTRTATLDELYTIKVSHSYWELEKAGPNNWNKHMWDVVFLQDKGAKLIPDLHKMLYKVWEGKHGSKRVNLNQQDNTFFKDAVVRIYDHDSVHYSVAYGDHPLYEDFFPKGETIKMDMTKIKAAPHELKIKLYREEVYATALERLVIPSNYTYSPRRAYAWALRRTITSLTRGWSATFLVENFKEMRTPDVDYVAVHKSKSHLLIPLDDSKPQMAMM